jgi:hypothetical protein
MSSLRSALDELRLQDLDRLTDRQLEDEFAEIERARRLLEGERLRRLAAIDRRGSFKDDGYLSSTAWLVHRFRETPAVAGRDVHLAAALEHMSQTDRALVEGDIPLSAVSLLASARETSAAAFAQSEALLVDAARSLDPRDLRRAVDYWKVSADAEEVRREQERAWERRRLQVSQTIFGMVRVDGDLDPETGQTLLTALRAVQDAEARDADPTDDRTPGQRRAHALGVICRRWLDDPDRPLIAGERPHINVLVDVRALSGRAGHTSELGDLGPVHPALARRLSCDAALSRVVTTGTSEPLDVGRKARLVPVALRRAVTVRDRHCRFPGCRRPESWCDCHHVVHWADGGPTSLANLVLLCRRHHRLAHSRFTMEMTTRGPVFRRRDGSVIDEGRAPP